MFRTLPHPVSSLALTLCLGGSALAAQGVPLRPLHTLPKAQLDQVVRLQPARVAQVQNHLRGLGSQLNLKPQESFQVAGAFTNAQGQTVTLVNHTYEGHRVWGERMVAKVGAEGKVSTFSKSLKAMPVVKYPATLTADEAIARATHQLQLMGAPTRAPQAELVVFPMRLRPENPILDPVTGQPMRLRRNPAEGFQTHVWAYEVKLSGTTVKGIPAAAAILVDGRSGQILRVDNLRHAFTAPGSRPALAGTPTPATGTGHGFYRGTVSIPTTDMGDGTFALWDTTRGTRQNDGLLYATQGDGTLWAPTGNQVWYSAHTPGGSWLYQDYVFQGNPLNTWGDGLSWATPDWGNENDTHGQTVGVDAMAGLTATYDFFDKVFNRKGPDGQDTAIFAAVLRNADGMPEYADEATFDVYGWGLMLGAGSYDAATRPTGQLSQTDLDVIAHEMTHGVTYTTAYLMYPYDEANSEEPALNEASSDFFAQMTLAHASRGAGDDATVIPATGATWQMGTGVNRGTPLRWMDKPSKDGRSVDAWHDGILYMDGHYSAGVLNRALYFLAQGSGAPGTDAHTPYLPTPMTGIGNDAAARIWFKALTEYLPTAEVGELTFMSAREAALQAATDLYGDPSAAVAAVKNAFAGVNVGDHDGQATPRTKVWFAPWRNGDWLETYIAPFWANRQEVPMGETITLRAQVDHATDTRVTWSIGGPSIFNGTSPGMFGAKAGGTINPDGTYHVPNLFGKWVVTATSVADPNQRAEGRLMAFRIDLDSDGEQDALDLGATALNWNLYPDLDPNASIYQLNGVDDEDVFRICDIIANAWPVK